jgi:hypothetical protein
MSRSEGFRAKREAAREWFDSMGMGSNEYFTS